MNTSLVLTILADDRPGLVESVAGAVAAHGGNWVESRMARLGGKFAGILRVDVPSARAEELTRALRGLEATGLSAVVEPTAAETRPADARRLVLEIVGQDRAGIIRDVSRALAGQDVSVDELHTECASAPESGGTLFRARAVLHVPARVATDQLRDALEQIANDLMVDVVLDEGAATAAAGS